MNRTKVFSSLLAFLILFSCDREGKSVRHLVNLGNTPYQQDTILVTYATNPKRALTLLDSAVILGNINEYEEQIVRATIYSKSLTEQHQDSALRIGEALLQHDSVKHNPDNYANVIDLLITTSRAKADDNEYLRWSTAKAELCRKQGEEVELLRTEAEIGFTMTHLGQVDEGIDKIDNSIRQLDEPGSVDRMDAFIIASKRKITILNELGRFKEAIDVAQHILDRLEHFEQHSKEYAIDSYRLPWNNHPDDRDRYVDFSRAQAHGFIAVAYAKMGDNQKARQHLALFDQSNYGQSFSARRMIIPAQMALGMYDEAMSTSNRIVQEMGTDTVNPNYATILFNRAIVARTNNHTDEALNLMIRYAHLSKVVNDSLHKSKAHDYAAKYHAKEQQLKIQKVESDSRQKTIISIATTLLLIIMTIAAFYFRRQHEHIVKKNRALVRMINEANQLTVVDDTPDDTIEDSFEDNIDSTDVSAQPIGNVQQQRDESDSSQINDDIFDTIDATIRSERIYANSSLQRQDVCERFKINRTMLNYMLLQHRGNASLPQYINSIRLEEAVKLLRNCPDMSITAIATAVGFSPANLRKQFIRNLGITPLEYRQNL